MNAGRQVLFIFFITWCFWAKMSAQSGSPRIFKNLNVADGLPQSFVSGLIQDNIGFIWIGTRDGLARYDGRKFKIFRHVPGDTATLSNNIISSLFLDRSGRLWILYETDDIDVLDTKTEALFHFTEDSRYKAAYTPVKAGHTMAEDKAGNIWMLCNNGGLLCCNLEKKIIRFYSDTALQLPGNKIAGIAEHNGNVLLITDTAFITIDSTKNILSRVSYTFSNPHLYDALKKWKDIYAVFRQNGEMVIQDFSRIIIYQPSGAFKVLELPEKDISNDCMVKDSNDGIYLNYNRNVYFLSRGNELSLWRRGTENPLFGFKSLLVDRSGVLWTGGNGSGIQMYDLRLPRLAGLPYEKSFHEDILHKYLGVPEAVIKNTFLYGMHAYRFRWLKGSDGKIWFSKAEGVPVARPEVCYYKNGRLIQPEWHYTDTITSTHVNINAMAFSNSGKMWGIDFFLRPVLFDTLTKAVKVYPPVASGNFDYTYTASGLLVDGEDKFWISTALNGLYYYNAGKKEAIHYTYSRKPGGLPTNQLMNLVQDPGNRDILWIGSMGGGLIKFSKSTGRCQLYTTKEGLPNNTIYAVITDPDGMLWCSCNKGIFSFNRATGAVRSFTLKDGLPGDEFNRYHFLELPNHRLAFGGVDGFTVFNPLDIARDDFQPAIALTGITINNVPADFGAAGSPLKSAINSLRQIVLPYNHNFLTFEFAALQYNITEKLQYRYMLEGFDESWVNAGNTNTAAYTKIEPGHYVFRINATNTAGEWSSNIKTLSVVIKPPFWKTWWFIVLGIIAAAAAVYLLIQARISEVRKEEQRKAEFEREASELKAQALRAQMNPHFIFNCLNSIKALIQEDKKQQAVIYLTTFSKLIRSQISNAQREVSLFEELETCRLYASLESLRFGTSIVCKFEIGENVDVHSVQVPPLILQPFIENAIWHGILPREGGNVKISVTDQGNYVRCTIDDDGVGRETSMRNKSQKSSTYQSKGMKLVQGRLNLHNIINNQGGNIELIDKKDAEGQSSGTLVVVNLQKKEA